MLNEQGSWSEMANQAQGMVEQGRAEKPAGMLGFLSRKRGRDRSPKAGKEKERGELAAVSDDDDEEGGVQLEGANEDLLAQFRADAMYSSDDDDDESQEDDEEGEEEVPQLVEKKPKKWFQSDSEDEEKESKKKRRKGKDARHVVEQPETLEDMEDMAARLLG